MGNKLFTFLVVSLIVGVITYIALDNIMIAAIVLATYVLASMFIFVPMLNKHSIKVKRYHECYHFINNFVIALSIKKSIGGSLETTVNSMPNEFIELYESLENMTDKEKLNYLSSYFYFYVYQLFLQIINLWEEQGGDILQMSKYLIGEVRNNEEYITKSDAMAAHKYVEISILWGFSLLIIVILRFSLKDFYQSIKGKALFVVSICLTMFFVLMTIYLLTSKGTNLKLKGNGNEKNA